MARKLIQTLLLLAVVGLFTSVSFADQITLSNSTSGQIQFAGQNPTTAEFMGTVSGFGLYGATLGTYEIWQTGSGNPILTNQISDTYDVSMGGVTLNFSMVLTDGSSITGTIDLTELIGGSTHAPEFLCTFSAATETGQ